MKRIAIVTAITAASLCSAVWAAQAPQPKHKISQQKAEAAAVKKLGGKAVNCKYEYEDGRWQYAVVVNKGGQLWEAEVNATTGKVLATEKTTTAAEAKEEAADKKK